MKHKSIFVSAGAVMASFAAYANSPFISKVLDFCPAPGQFVNVVPEIPSDATEEDVNAIVLGQIGGDRNPGMVSLGAYGGYVVFAFDHPVVNLEGEYDFRIYGNALSSSAGGSGGGSEPGIVMVSEDVNGNGLADDPWYEIAGSEHSNPLSFRDFRITYHKTPADHQPVPDVGSPAVVDKEYIMFTTNQPGFETGYVQKNRFHAQSYWPEWIKAETLEFEGTRLPGNAVNKGEGGAEYWVLNAFGWGYADNLPNNDEPGIKIEWAVDSEGNPVHLDKIDFIKVYTGVSQSCGWIGETSTEICGAEDLHPDAAYNGVENVFADDSILTLVGASRDAVCVRTDLDGVAYEMFSVNGMRVAEGTLRSGDNHIGTGSLSGGVYVLRAGNRSLKISGF